MQLLGWDFLTRRTLEFSLSGFIMAFMGYFPPVAQKLTPCKAEEMAQQLRYLFLMVSETYFYLFILRWGLIS